MYSDGQGVVVGGAGEYYARQNIMESSRVLLCAGGGVGGGGGGHVREWNWMEITLRRPKKSSPSLSIGKTYRALVKKPTGLGYSPAGEYGYIVIVQSRPKAPALYTYGGIKDLGGNLNRVETCCAACADAGKR